MNLSNAKFGGVGGAVQRGTIVVGWGWLSMLAVRLLRGHPGDGTLTR